MKVISISGLHFKNHNYLADTTDNVGGKRKQRINDKVLSKEETKRDCSSRMNSTTQ